MEQPAMRTPMVAPRVTLNTIGLPLPLAVAATATLDE